MDPQQDYHEVESSATRLEALTGYGRVDASAVPSLREVASGLRCHTLELSGTSIERLPEDIDVSLRIDLTGCTRLGELPPSLRTGALVLVGCTALRVLPEHLSVSFLDISGCDQITELPASLRVRRGRLRMRDCTAIRCVPETIGPLAQLDVAGCANLEALPSGLQVTSWVDIADTRITSLPDSMRGVGIQWRGVPIDERLAFHPETVAAQEALHERNAERRRVMIERIGYERFLLEVNAEVLDADTDPGGPRSLLRVPLDGDEPLVCVSVRCPSTGKAFLLRVPPKMRSCHQAVAWTAGFDNPGDYRPILET